MEQKPVPYTSFFLYKRKGSCRCRATVMLCRGTAYFGDVPIGIGVRRSREGSVSQRAFAPDGREKFLDFALYGRRSAAG